MPGVAAPRLATREGARSSSGGSGVAGTMSSARAAAGVAPSQSTYVSIDERIAGWCVLSGWLLPRARQAIPRAVNATAGSRRITSAVIPAI